MTGRHLALVGPTASGKTAAAVAFARRHGGIELVSVDAMAVYRDLDIGTAKPTPAERSGVTWHLVDVVAPHEEFSVAAFQEQVRAAIAEIEERGNRALLVGGTGLYHRAAVDGLAFAGRFPDVAAELEVRADAPSGVGALYALLQLRDPEAARRIEPTNRRRIIRALEVTLGSGRRFSSYGSGMTTYSASRFRLIGLSIERSELADRIERRLDDQLARGLLDEVRRLRERPLGLSRTARQALAYRELLAHLDGELTFDDARELTLVRTRRFARRQESWFRRDPRICWLDALDPLLSERLDECARRR